MKGFIKKILAFATIVVLLGIVIEIRLYYSTNELSYKRKYMEEHAGGIKTLLIGASNAASGIDPAAIGDSCFDLAASAQQFRITKSVCEKFLPSCTHVKNVVLPIAYHLIYTDYVYPLNKTDDAARMKDSEKCKYLKYMGIMDNDNDWIYWLETIWLKSNMFGRLRGGGKMVCDSLGFERRPLSKRSATWKTDAIYPEEKDEFGNADRCFEDNVQNIRTIARLCKERGARLILLSTPYYETAQKVTLGKQRSTIHRFVEEICKDGYDNVVYKEYTFDPRFKDNDFWNATHLTGNGSVKFARILRHDFNL